YVINTDNQALMNSRVPNKIQLGEKLTKGLGAGAEPTIGREAAEEDIEKISEILEGTDMVFITAGMGGGTGTGAAPVIARIAKEKNILTVGIVSKPFAFEGPRRLEQAEEGIKNLINNVDTLITIPNEKLLDCVSDTTGIDQAFAMVDSILIQAVQGISDLITNQGFINTDFADVTTIMKEKGEALMGIGSGSGANKAIEAAEDAIDYPLIESGSISGAMGLLLNFRAGPETTILEITEAAKLVQSKADPYAKIIFGLIHDESYRDKVSITVIATGISREVRPAPEVSPNEIVDKFNSVTQKRPKMRVMHKPPVLPHLLDDGNITNIPAYVRFSK
ncbi:MAG: cell division protein FtsZ, partial [Actinomycetia bacterium]|nr:cell division protein FtsZ [Actinomycetes bacterium]